MKNYAFRVWKIANWSLDMRLTLALTAVDLQVENSPDYAAISRRRGEPAQGALCPPGFYDD